MQPTTSIKTIRHKVERLGKACLKLSDENKKLKKQVQELAIELKEQKLSANQLQETNKVLKIAKSLGADHENVAVAQKTINELVREIDKCIALMNR